MTRSQENTTSLPSSNSSDTLKERAARGNAGATPAGSHFVEARLRSEDANWPAFPNQELGTWPGLTIRQYVATQIMAGLWAFEGDKDHSYEGAAQTVVEQTDALLAELAKPYPQADDHGVVKP